MAFCVTHSLTLTHASAACTLLAQIQSGRSNLKLAGVSIGDGAIDPRTQFTGFGKNHTQIEQIEC